MNCSTCWGDHMRRPARGRARFIAVWGACLAMACGDAKGGHDASGVFEATEVIISAETAGRILTFPVEEGQLLKAQELAATIDCAQLELQKAQAVASEQALGEKTTDAAPQVQILREQAMAQERQVAAQTAQLAVLKTEQARFAELVAASAAPAKQLADIEGAMAVLEKQIAASQGQVAVTRQQMKSALAQAELQNRAIGSESGPMKARISQIDDQIARCQVVNPVEGTVLVKYAERNEFAAPGKPLYKIADLRVMTLRAYATGAQLRSVKPGQVVRVLVDAGTKTSHELQGTVAWISDKAEFTPKTIQTKDERANLVYALKIRIPNDGALKIGMYAEVKF